MPDFLPKTDSALNDWAQNFATEFEADEASTGLTSTESAAFRTLADAYNDAFVDATNPATRTAVTIAAKNTAKLALTTAAREYVRRIQAYPALTDETRARLAITIRDYTPTIVGAPGTRPILQLIDNAGNQHALKVRDELTPLSQQKPPGIISAEVWVKVGGEPPTSIAQCSYQGDLTRNPFTVGFAGDDEGKRAYYIARWKTRRGLVGPESQVLTTSIAA